MASQRVLHGGAACVKQTRVVSPVGSPGGQAEHVPGWLVGSTLWCPFSATWMHLYIDMFFFSVPGDFRFRETILSLVRKRHRGWSNSSAIGALDRGFLRKKARDSCVVKTTTKKKRADGKRTYSGNRWLKGTQPGPHQESFFADLRACRMQKVFSLHQLKKVQVISSGLRTQSSAHTAQALGQMQWASSFAF